MNRPKRLFLVFVRREELLCRLGGRVDRAVDEEPSGVCSAGAGELPCHRVSLARELGPFELFAGFGSSQKCRSWSVKLRRLVCPSRSVHVFMSAKTATVRPTPLLS